MQPIVHNRTIGDMNKQATRRKALITFIVPFTLVLIINIFNVKLPLWLYLEHIALFIYGFTPEWLDSWMGHIAGWISIHLYIVYAYIRNVLFVLKNRKKS